MSDVVGVVMDTLPHAMYKVRLEQGSMVLAHIAVFLESSPGESVHAAGFRRLAAAISARRAARGEDARVSRWHLLDPAVAQQIGRALLLRQW